MSNPPAGSILPLSVVWNLLSALSCDPTLKLEDDRLLDLLDQVGGRSKPRMMDEFASMIAAAQARELARR